jgi:O-antigen/teichoic acid export membrane protein
VSTRRVALNTLAPMAARIVDAAFALVYLRLLGRTDVGAYTFLVVFTTYLDTLIDFGLNALVAREVARGEASPARAFRTVNVLRLGLWALGLPVVAVVYGPLRGIVNLPDDAVLAGLLFYLALLPSVLAKTATGLLWAAERLDFTAAVSVGTTLLRVSIGGVALLAGLGLVGLGAASLLVNVFSATALVILAVRYAGARHTMPDITRGPGHWLRESWPLFVNQLLQGLFFKIDALLLPGLVSPAAAGVYAAAYRVSEGAGIVSSSFTLALFPRLAREHDLSGAYRLALRILLKLGVPLAAGIALLSESIIGVVGGREYLPDSAVALSILICYLPLSYANGLTQYVLIAAGRQRVLTAAFLAALGFNLLANLWLIPRFSYVGAAWVTVFSELVLLVPFRLVAAGVAPGVSLAREARAPLLATLLMAPVVWWLRDALHPIAAMVAGCLVYPLGLWSLGGFDEREQRLVDRLLRLQRAGS